MRRLVTMVVCFALLIGVPGRARTEESELRATFALFATPQCKRVMLTWQPVDGSAAFTVVRKVVGAVELTKEITDQPFFLDMVDAKEGTLLEYRIEARSNTGAFLGVSTVSSVLLDCLGLDCSLMQVYQAGSPMYWVNKDQKGPMAVTPELAFGRMFLVIKYVTEELGVKLDWSASEKKATITRQDDKTIELWIGKSKAKVNGVEVNIDASNPTVAPYLKSGRTMLPMRFVAEQLGATEILWDKDTQTAKISFQLIDCMPQNKAPFTFESLDKAQNIITAYDMIGTKCILTISARMQKSLEVLSKGQRFMAGLVLALTVGDSPKYVANKIEPIDSAKAQEVPCYIESSAKQILELADCDGAKKTLRSRLPDWLPTSMPKGFPVIALVKDEKVVDMRFALFERTCQQVQKVYITLSSASLPTRTAVCISDATGASPKKFKVRFGQTVAMEALKEGHCYELDCFETFLGEMIAISFKESDCSCSFAMTAAETLDAPAGGSFSMNLIIQNSEAKTRNYSITANNDDFESLKIAPFEARIEAEKTKIFVVVGTLKDGPTDPVTLEIVAKCGVSKRTTKTLIFGREPNIELINAEELMDFPICDNIQFTFSIKNSSSFTVICKPFAEFSEKLQGVWGMPNEITLEKGKTKRIEVTAKWAGDAEVGDKIVMTFGVYCGKKKIANQMRLLAVPGEPNIYVINIMIGDFGDCIVMAKIDWKIYRPGQIAIDWGDGSKEEVSSFPISHEYAFVGTYTVKITARAQTGETGTERQNVKYLGLYPDIKITNASIRGISGLKMEVYFEGKINWREKKKKSILFQFSDGESVESDFPILHMYNFKKNEDMMDASITIIASTTSGEVSILKMRLFKKPEP